MHSQFETELDPSRERPAWWTSLDVWWANLLLPSVLLPSDAVYGGFPIYFLMRFHISVLVRVWHAIMHLFMFDILAFQRTQCCSRRWQFWLGVIALPITNVFVINFIISIHKSTSTVSTVSWILFGRPNGRCRRLSGIPRCSWLPYGTAVFFILCELQWLYYYHIMIILYSYWYGSDWAWMLSTMQCIAWIIF